MDNSAIGGRVLPTHMHTAQHRMESSRRPLGRAILWLDALIASAAEAYAEHKQTKVGQCCVEFLRFLSNEAVLQLAMLADATDEHMMMLRFHDNESFDTALGPEVVSNFLARIKYLFHEGGCFRTGYTKHALSLLSRARTYILDGRVRTIGGAGQPSPQIKALCLDRMKQWVFLTTLTLEAEFPVQDIFSGFAAFSLGPAMEGAVDEGKRLQIAKNLKILADSFELDFEELQREFWYHLPVARRIAKEKRCGNFDAWRESIQIAQSKHQGRRNSFTFLQAIITKTFFGGGEQANGCLNVSFNDRCLGRT